MKIYEATMQLDKQMKAQEAMRNATNMSEFLAAYNSGV